MLPYCNRIEDGRFAWNGVRYQLDPGFGDQRHALHGVGLRQPWNVQQASPAGNRAHSGTRCHRRARDDIGRSRSVPCCVYRYSNNSLRVTLTVTNRHKEPAPLGIGLHPYFARPPGVTLQFEAGGVWMNGEEPLPRRHASVPAEWDHSNARTVGDEQLDNCFTNWTAPGADIRPRRRDNLRGGRCVSPSTGVYTTRSGLLLRRAGQPRAERSQPSGPFTRSGDARCATRSDAVRINHHRLCLGLHREARSLTQMQKAMHAEHADNSQLYELSARVIGCENALAYEGANHLRVLRASPFFICVKILS